jgi:hypothetical protein
VNGFVEQQRREEATIRYFAGSEVVGRPRGAVLFGLAPPMRVFLHGIARDILGRRESLAFAMRHLSERLEQEAVRVDAGDGFNAHGAVQGHGYEIDRQVGEAIAKVVVEVEGSDAR